MNKWLISVIMLLFITCITNAQDFEDTNYVTVIGSPGSLNDGFSMGVQYEYQNRTVYVGPEVYVFPDLNKIDYSHYIARIGLNQHIGKFYHIFRLYAGGRFGVIRRAKKIHAMMGIEGGFDVYVPNTPLYFRASACRDMKADSEVWGEEDHHMVNSVIVGIGIKF